MKKFLLVGALIFSLGLGSMAYAKEEGEFNYRFEDCPRYEEGENLHRRGRSREDFKNYKFKNRGAGKRSFSCEGRGNKFGRRGTCRRLERNF